MKIFASLISVLIGLTFTGCTASHMTDQAYYSLLKHEGLVPFIPPQGNPDHPQDWTKYGPGTVIRKSTYEYEQSATSLLGADGVANARSPVQAADYHIFNNKTVSGSNLDANGGYALQAVADLQGKLDLSNVTDIEVTFGNTKISQPLAIDDFRKIVRAKASTFSPETRQNIRQGKSDIITAAVYTDSLTFTFKKSVQNGADAKVNVTDKDLGDLSAKGYRTIDGSVVVPTKTFLYYRPLENAGELLPR